MSKLEINEINERDWEMYKSLRLTSLSDSPDSFGSTLEREAAFTKEEWKSRLSVSSGLADVLPLVGYYEERAVGLASGVLHEANSKSAHVYQMWVSPECRGLGVGRALLTRIVSWANGLQLGSLFLAVTTTNIEAIALYSSFGFLPEGETEPLREGSNLVMQPMKLNLGSSNA